MTKHPAVMAGKHGEEGAAAEVESQKWQRFPVPGVQASKDTKKYTGAVFSLQQPLWTGGKITAGIDAAKARLQAAKHDLRETRLEVLQSSIDAYAEALVRQSQIGIMREGITQHKRLFEMISRRVEREISPRADKELAHSRLRSAENDLSYADQSLSKALTTLTELTGIEVTAVTGSHEQYVAVTPVEKNEAYKLAIENSPAISSLEFSRQAADADIEAKRAAFWPMLSLRLEKNAGPNSEQRAMLYLESQFGAGLSASSNVSAAVSSREAISWQRQSAERDLKNRVAQEWDAYAESRRRFENTRATSVSAWQVYESYARLYSISQKSWLDVLNSLREAVQAKTAVETASAEVIRSSLRLNALIGKLFPDVVGASAPVEQ